MPLQKGRSKKAVSNNISEMMHGFKDTGMIGNSKPANTKKAQKQAIAAAMSKSGMKKGGKSSAAKKTGKK